MNFLIIDDSPTIRLTLRKILEGLEADGSEVQEADGEEAALEQFRRQRPDVVFLDIELGHKDGHDVLRELLRIEPETRVILATSAARADERVTDALGQGAFAFVEKPLRRDEIARVLAEIEHESRRTRRVH